MANGSNAKALIDGIVRQTTILIGQISTSTGIRAPLSQIADRVFLELARELEAQGVGKKVVADMFGMALRTYQKKVRRLEESLSEQDRTLWEALLEYIGQHQRITRRAVYERFAKDNEQQVAAVLNDLVQSGLLYCTGRGLQAVFGVTTDADRRVLQETLDFDAACNLIWLFVYQHGPANRASIEAESGMAGKKLDAAIETLIADGRLQVTPAQDAAPTVAGAASATADVYHTAQLVIAAEESAGWEAAFLDHFRAMTTALSHKLQLGFTRPTPLVGGVTYTFDVPPGHPYRQQVQQLGTRLRAELDELWDKVAAHNKENPPPPDGDRVTIYLGQNTRIQ